MLRVFATYRNILSLQYGRSKVFARQESMFVRKAKMMDYWSQSDDALEAEFPDSLSIVMVDKDPLITVESGKAKVAKFETSDLRERLNMYGLEVGLLNSVLLDSVCPSEESPDFKPIFGCTVRTMKPPPESGIQEDRLRHDLSESLGGKFISLRMAMLTLEDEEDRRLLAKLQAITRWYLTYRRCPSCGTPLRLRPSKTAARCLRCDKFFYPTISPVAITLVHNEANDKALLVRHKASVPNVYTLVAGFATPGETLHETAKREIAEEVGIEASNVKMLDVSQPWPMPFNSLMCGFEATANPDDELSLCQDELHAAAWFTRKDVCDAIKRINSKQYLSAFSGNKDATNANDFLYIPPHGAVAHYILKKWALKE